MIENLLLIAFATAAVTGGVLMIVLRQPMRVALALIATMISLGGIYGLLGVHVIAVFQIMIYVGAVMVFMVYAIMLLDVRDPSFTERYSRLLWPGVAACTVLAGVLMGAVWQGGIALPNGLGESFGVQPFSAAFLNDYWLYFELTSVLLVVAVLAAVAVVQLRSVRRG
ncbi:MAG: NADH-quinone oxidoreductase subunit J [Aquincola sp.]|nr:NADH-quinone oxidoreductase subunit J [Aquincola sp.]MDH4288270.1 NADH-quinone oxidoreductase subunit J [Aquincola sp.]